MPHSIHVKDVFPQWINLTAVVESTPGTYATVETTMPVQIDASQVIEVLGMEWDFGGAALSAVDADFDSFVTSQITVSIQTAELNLGDRRVVDKAKIRVNTSYAESTETGGAGFATQPVIMHDFASSGKGFLVAAQSLHHGIDQVGSSAATAANCTARMLSRLVTVSSRELIGIVLQ